MQLHENDTIFHNWKIKKIIGEGSFGTVYEIEREEFGRTYKAAAKVISIPKNQSDYMDILDEGMTEENVTEYYRSLVDDIIGECDLMERMKGDSHIVSYEDHHVGMMADGMKWTIYIRMELLKPLGIYMKENPFTQKDVIQLGIDLCRGLETCQKFNVIHRDIKPENIFVSDAHNYKLGDFGISKVMGRSEMAVSKKGTQVYMAPEVYRGEQYDTTVDIYSLGIVLFRLMNNNRTPFLPSYPTPIRFKDKEAALQKRLMGEPIPKPCNASEKFAEVIQKACSFKAKDRYQKPHELRKVLESLLEEDIENEIIEEKTTPFIDVEADKEGGTIGVFRPGQNISVIKEEARRREEEEEKKRQEEEERRKAEEQEKRRLEEEEERKKAEYEAWREIVVEGKRQEEEARRREEERKRQEEEARRREEEERKRQEEEARRRKEEERKRQEEEARQKAIEEAKKKAEESRKWIEEEKKNTENQEKTMLPHYNGGTEGTAEDSKIKLRQENNSADSQEKVVRKNTGTQDNFDDFKDLEPIMIGASKKADDLHNVSIEKKEPIYSDGKRETLDKKKMAVILSIIFIFAGILCIFQMRRVPDVTGMTLEEAKTAFEQAGMQLGDADYKFSDQIPQGSIISQKKKGGHFSWKNSRQAVVVSDGTKRTQMPDLTNKTLKEAADILDAMHLNLMVAVRPVYSLTAETESVCGQEPAAGETIQKGADVVLCISQGGFAMPDLRGKSKEEAENILAQMGITAAFEEEFNKDVAAGQVSSQSVEPETLVGAETSITLKISMGTETFGVPDVVGMTQEKAVQALIAAGYNEKKITVSQEYSDGTAAGVVIYQSIAGDTQVEKGSNITITVSMGKKPQSKPASGGGSDKSDGGWNWEELD